MSRDHAIKHLRFSTMSVPPQYEDAFRKAVWTFQYQRVYDPVVEDIVHLSNITDDLGTDCDFLGPWLPQDVAKGIAKGDVDPITKLPFLAESGNTNLINANANTYFSQVRERRKLHLPVQKNTLINYFCLASIEAKRKFKPPQTKAFCLDSRNGTSPISEDLVSQESQPGNDDTKYNDVAFSTKDLDYGQHGQTCPSNDTYLADLAMNGYEDKENQPIEDEIVGNPRTCSLFFQSRNTLYKPFLTSHKKIDSDNVIDISMGKELAAPGVTVEISNNLKSSEGRGNATPDEGLTFEKENNSTCTSIQLDNGLGKMRYGIATKKRKDNCQIVQGHGTKTIKDVHLHSPTKGRNLDCDLSHLERYSGIAEESMEKFALAISAFRYTPKNGSRVSGLRAPPKDAQDSSCYRSAASSEEKKRKTTPLDFSKFAYKPKLSKHGLASSSLR